MSACVWGGVGERSGVKDMTKQRGNGSKKKKKLKSSRRGQQPVTAASKHVEDEIQPKHHTLALTGE